MRDVKFCIEMGEIEFYTFWESCPEAVYNQDPDYIVSLLLGSIGRKNGIDDSFEFVSYRYGVEGGTFKLSVNYKKISQK